jgi:non-heme chloroperoxidase
VIAHDRRGHGRSSQTWDGHDMDHYADDLAALTAHLNLKDAIHIGHSTGGGEVVHYLARHGESRVSKAAIISAVPPLMLKTAANPTGQPKEVFDGLQAQLAANRAQFYYDVAAGPFYGYNRPGAKPSQAVILNWWRQGMMGGTKAHYDGIVAFSQTDFTEDLKKISLPVLVMPTQPVIRNRLVGLGGSEQGGAYGNSTVCQTECASRMTTAVMPPFAWPSRLCCQKPRRNLQV